MGATPLIASGVSTRRLPREVAPAGRCYSSHCATRSAASITTWSASTILRYRLSLLRWSGNSFLPQASPLPEDLASPAVCDSYRSDSFRSDQSPTRDANRAREFCTHPAADAQSDTHPALNRHGSSRQAHRAGPRHLRGPHTIAKPPHQAVCNSARKASHRPNLRFSPVRQEMRAHLRSLQS